MMLLIRKIILAGLLAVVFFAAGCTSIGQIENAPVSQLPVGEKRYSASHYAKQHPVGDTLFLLAFSGGGTRAAALSYGVLEELRDTQYRVNGEDAVLLDEVDRISSVSGGSFTAAYYGLFGEQIFEDFREVFLYKDVQGDLSSLIFGVFDLLGRMFSPLSRTEVAISYYDKHIFRGKTFADLQQAGGPFIMINASDLSARSQFVFIQPQFDFLCSDLSQFKVSRAVAASSAVPILFPPILIKKHKVCNFKRPAWLAEAGKRAERQDDSRAKELVAALNFYLDDDSPSYVTLLDGGITDNLGLRTILRNVSLSGDIRQAYQNRFGGSPLKRVVIIVVNASTTSETDVGKSVVLPSIGDVLTAVTDIQLHLYNTETNALTRQQLMVWAETLSTVEHPIEPYFIELDVVDIADPEERMKFNDIPTSFSLEKAQADALISTARRLLRHNPEYQKLLRDIGAETVVH